MAGKKAAFALFVLFLFAAFFCGTAQGTDTTLTTSVPSMAEAEIRLTGSGRIRINMEELGANGIVTVPRLKEVEIEVLPEEGYRLKTFVLNGEAMNSSRALVTLQENAVIEVSFEAVNAAPQTGEGVWLRLAVSAVAFSFLALAFFFLFGKKRSAKPE